MRARVLLAICVLLAIDGATVAQNWRWFAPELSCWMTQEKLPASWEDAKQNCETNGAVLASPLNTQVFEYMKTLINVHNHSAAYFIGTRANRLNDGQVQYLSIEGRQLKDMPKAVFDEIDKLDLELGDCLSLDRLGIRSVSCWDPLPYLCYSKETTECGSSPPTTTTTTTTTTTLRTTSALPPGYTYEPATGSFYKFHDKIHVTFYDANTTCASEGAHVVVLNSAVEAAIVAAVGKNTTPNGNDLWIWTGLCDTKPGGVRDWRTINGEPLGAVYNIWYNDHPSNAQQACALFNKKDKKMYDYHYGFKNYNVAFTCEISP